LRNSSKSAYSFVSNYQVATTDAYGVSVTENCNGVTEFCNGEQSLNQAPFAERRWAEPDLNRRPLARKASSNESIRAADWLEFKDWVYKKYAKSYAHTILLYAKKHHHLLSGNLKEIDKISVTTRNNAVKSRRFQFLYENVHKPQ